MTIIKDVKDKKKFKTFSKKSKFLIFLIFNKKLIELFVVWVSIAQTVHRNSKRKLLAEIVLDLVFFQFFIVKNWDF